MERAHGIVLPQVRGVDVGGEGLDIYKFSFPRILKLVNSPVEGLPSKSKNGKAKGTTLCFVNENQWWPYCSMERNRYCGVVSTGYTFRRPESSNIGSRTSSINLQREGFGIGMWILR